MHIYQKVYKLVKKIPKGKVATYGQIGQMLGLNPRVIGWALNRLAKYKPKTRQRTRDKGQQKKQNTHANTNAPAHMHNIPWQRVINAKGSISTNKLLNIPLGLQQKLLEKEGVKFNAQNKTDLKRYLWKKGNITA